MQNIRRILFWIGVADVIASVAWMVSPFVMQKTTKNPIKRFMYKRKQRKIINMYNGIMMGVGALAMTAMPLYQTIRSRVRNTVDEGMKMANAGMTE